MIDHHVHGMNNETSEAFSDQQHNTIMLALLNAIGSSDRHTQRDLAGHVGVALGLANALLRRCVTKGWIKIRNIPPRRYAYYLTPKGFSEKGRLVAEYLEASLFFFRSARQQYEQAFAALASRNVKQIALAGSGELAEIALLSASAAGLSVVAVIAPGRNAPFHDRPVVHDVIDAFAMGAEAVAIANSETPQKSFDELRQVVSSKQIVTISLLHIDTTPEQMPSKEVFP